MTQSDAATATILLSAILGVMRLHRAPADSVAKAQARHDVLLKDAIQSHRGRILRNADHAFAAIFDSPRDAFDAALAIQRTVRVTVWEDLGTLPVRLTLATGDALGPGREAGAETMERAQRMLDLTGGSQTFADAATFRLLAPDLPKGVVLESVETGGLVLPFAESLYRLASAELESIVRQQIVCGTCGAVHLPNTIYCDVCGNLLAQYNRPDTDRLGSHGIAPADGRGSPSHQFELLSSDGNRRLALTLAGTSLIGRTDPSTDSYPDIDLGALEELDGGVSRRHARLHVAGTQILLEDLNSLNGTYVQGLRLIAFRPYALQSGDELQFGKVIYKISW